MKCQLSSKLKPGYTDKLFRNLFQSVEKAENFVWWYPIFISFADVTICFTTHKVKKIQHFRQGLLRPNILKSTFSHFFIVCTYKESCRVLPVRWFARCLTKYKTGSQKVTRYSYRAWLYQTWVSVSLSLNLAPFLQKTLEEYLKSRTLS